MNPVAIIPARYASTRLPAKLLQDLCGKPVIQRVYERVHEAGIFEKILVATDSEEIFSCVEGFGGKAVMTGAHHRCGTERIAEAVKGIESDCIINVQGDEPFLHPDMLRMLWESFREEPVASMGTLRHRLSSEEDLWNRNVVKVVTDREGYALYFSRSPIPHVDNREKAGNALERAKGLWYKHVGVYAYRRDFLLKYPSLDRSFLEETESLEQLRALEHGYRIRVYDTEWQTLGIDTEADLLAARKHWKTEKNRTPSL